MKSDGYPGKYGPLPEATQRNQSEFIKALGGPTEYTCPKCGSPVQHTVLCSYPGQDKYKCTRCDYLKVIPQQVRTQVAPT